MTISTTEQVARIYDALNDSSKQEAWANQYMEIFNSVKPETKMQMSEAMFDLKAKLNIRLRACKALMFITLQDELSGGRL